MTPPRGSASRDPHDTAADGLLARLRRSRRADAPPAPVAHTGHGAWTIDRAVRVLATACTGAGREIPAVLAVIVGADTVWFRMATPDEQPPAGWTAEPGGRTWHAELRWLQGAPVDESPREPYPRLVSLGATQDGPVLFNLGQAGGEVCLDGDGRQAAALADAWTRELTTSPWARGVRVVRLGFRTDPANPVGGIEAANLADAESALGGPEGGVLLLAGPPGGRDADRIRRLADDPTRRWSVVVVGRVEDAPWHFTVDRSGLVDTGFFESSTTHRPDPPADAAAFPDAAASSGAVAAVAGQPSGVTARPHRARATAIIVGAVCLLAIALLVTVPVLTRRSNTSQALTTPTTTTQPSPTQPSPTPSESARPSPTQSSPSASKRPSPSHSPTVTQQVSPGGTGTIHGVSSGLCVDSDTNPAMTLNGTPSGGHAFGSGCNSAGSQRWAEGPLLSQDTPRADDMYRLVNKQTGFCLDSDGQGGIYTLPCLDPDAFQVWQRLRPSTTTVAYRNQSTNRCLSLSTTDHTLSTQPCPTGTTWPKDMQFRRLP